MKRRNTEVVIWSDFFEEFEEFARKDEINNDIPMVGSYVIANTDNFAIFSTKTEKVYQYDDLEIVVGKDNITTEMRNIISKVFKEKKCPIRYLDEIRVMAEICHQYEVKDF